MDRAKVVDQRLPLMSFSLWTEEVTDVERALRVRCRSKIYMRLVLFDVKISLDVEDTSQKCGDAKSDHDGGMQTWSQAVTNTQVRDENLGNFYHKMMNISISRIPTFQRKL